MAEAHLQCIKRDKAQGKRFLLCNRTLWMREIGQTLNEQFAHLGYTIPTAESRYCLVKFFGYFRADAAKVAVYWGREMHLNSQRSKDVLGINYRPTEDSLREMAESLMD